MDNLPLAAAGLRPPVPGGLASGPDVWQRQIDPSARPGSQPVSDEAKAPGANTMWGGRFSSSPSALMEAINASIDFDRRLAAQDIQGSLAHAAMLARQGIIDAADRDAIHAGLQRILGEIETGSMPYSNGLGRYSHEYREPPERDRRVNPRPACTPPAAATTRSPSTCVCGFARPMTGRRSRSRP